MRIVAADEAGLARAVDVVLAGGLIVYPTETLYGLGADATSDEAVARVLEAKGRPENQPFPILVLDRQMLAAVVRDVPEAAERLMEKHWPGPLTLVLPARPGLPRPLTNAAGGVGVRVCADPVAAALVRRAGRPLTATSANRSGAPPATCPGEVDLDGVGLVVDDGRRAGQPSTVVDVTGGAPRVLRRGVTDIGACGDG